MNRDNKRIASEKPVVIVRKKGGKGSTPTGPTPRAESHPATKATAPVLPPEPPMQPLQPPQPLARPRQPEASPQPQPTEELVLSKTAERKRRRSEVLEILRTRWPQTFPRDFRQIRPWATGIAQDVVRLLPEQPYRGVKDAISVYRLMATPSYCRALLQGGSRYDLDGNPRGEVTPEDQERARQDLKAFYERRREKQKRPPAEKVGASPET
jgi:ProP effector